MSQPPLITLTGQAYGPRPQFSRTHLESAAALARRAYDLELDLNQPVPLTSQSAYAIGYARDNQRDMRYIEHTACVIGAIFAAVAAMDAMVSEVFVDAHEVWVRAQEAKQLGGVTTMTALDERLALLWIGDQANNSSSRSITNRIPKRIRRLYRLLQRAMGKTVKKSVRYEGIPDRTRSALRSVNKGLSDITCWQDTKVLIDLRNFLTHYTGGVVWTFSSLPDQPVSPPHPLQAILERNKQVLGGRGIERTPIGSGRVFPYSHLGHTCAEWSVLVSKQFVEQFCQAMNRRSPLSDIEAEDAQHGRSSRFAART